MLLASTTGNQCFRYISIRDSDIGVSTTHEATIFIGYPSSSIFDLAERNSLRTAHLTLIINILVHKLAC